MEKKKENDEKTYGQIYDNNKKKLKRKRGCAHVGMFVRTYETSIVNLQDIGMIFFWRMYVHLVQTFYILFMKFLAIFIYLFIIYVTLSLIYICQIRQRKKMNVNKIKKEVCYV